MSNNILLAGFSFSQHCVGIVTRPYETYRRIVDRATTLELLYIGVCVFIYLALASAVKQSLFHPFLLTQQFILLGVGALVTFALADGLFWQIGKWLGATGNLRGFTVAWGYTLIPTFVWFLGTSILYLVLPPPRTTSVLGITFSVVFLLFSDILLFWKIILSYLALRFGLRLDLVKILAVSVIVLPILGLYSVGMNKLGLFRVPFI